MWQAPFPGSVERLSDARGACELAGTEMGQLACDSDARSDRNWPAWLVAQRHASPSCRSPSATLERRKSRRTCRVGCVPRAALAGDHLSQEWPWRCRPGPAACGQAHGRLGRGPQAELSSARAAGGALRAHAASVPLVPAALQAAITRHIQDDADGDAGSHHCLDQRAALPLQVLAQTALHVPIQGDADVVAGAGMVSGEVRPIEMQHVHARDDLTHAVVSLHRPADGPTRSRRRGRGAVTAGRRRASPLGAAPAGRRVAPTVRCWTRQCRARTGASVSSRATLLGTDVSSASIRRPR